MSFWWWIAIGALALPGVAGSLFVCAPKWWTKKVKPWLGRNVKEPVASRLPSAPTVPVPETVSRAADVVNGGFQWLGNQILVRIIGLVATPFVLIALYAVWCFALIEGACPYTPAYETEKRDALGKVASALRTVSVDFLVFARPPEETTPHQLDRYPEWSG